jgi:hypothetical protein
VLFTCYGIKLWLEDKSAKLKAQKAYLI